ncbi:MAG: FHA domain-containing protein [Planctomycetota bacterium]
MTAVIEILSGDLEGRAYDIDEAPFTIGRKDDCAIVLPKKYVSRKHAEIVEQDGRYLVRGLSEKNPIVANDREVNELALEEGAEFEICGIRFRFRARGGRGATKDERKRQKVTVGADAPAPTTAYKKDAVRSRGGEDIEDGPLPGEGDEETKNYDGDAKGSAVKSGSQAGSAKGSGSGEEWRNAPGEGPRERVVFGDDESQATAAKKSQKGSGDDKEERTDQIDVSKFKGDVDPFADKRAEKTPEELAAREKFVKALVAFGVLGIALTGITLWAMRRTQPIKPIEIEFKVPCAPNEVRRYEDPLLATDPPEVQLDTPLDGSAVDSVVQAEDPNIAYVEWAVPDQKQMAYFLVRGVSPGEAIFQLRFKSGIIRKYKVRIEGVPKHETIKKQRMERLASLTAEDLKKEIHDRIRRGEELEKEATNIGPKQDRYPRQAIHDYHLAEEALEALVKYIDKQGTADPDIDQERSSVKAHVERAKEAWRTQLNMKKKTYDDVVKRKQWDEAVTELESLLWLIGDTCDLDYQRWNLLREKIFRVNGYGSPKWEGPACIEERK